MFASNHSAKLDDIYIIDKRLNIYSERFHRGYSRQNNREVPGHILYSMIYKQITANWWAILCHFMSFWAILGHFWSRFLGQFLPFCYNFMPLWAIFGPFGADFGSILRCFGQTWVFDDTIVISVQPQVTPFTTLSQLNDDVLANQRQSKMNKIINKCSCPSS